MERTQHARCSPPPHSLKRTSVQTVSTTHQTLCEWTILPSSVQSFTGSAPLRLRSRTGVGTLLYACSTRRSGSSSPSQLRDAARWLMTAQASLGEAAAAVVIIDDLGRRERAPGSPCFDRHRC